MRSVNHFFLTGGNIWVPPRDSISPTTPRKVCDIWNLSESTRNWHLHNLFPICLLYMIVDHSVTYSSSASRTVFRVYLSAFIDRIHPPLIQVDQKYNVIAETGNTVHSGHLDDEREEVIDEGVDKPRERRKKGKRGVGPFMKRRPSHREGSDRSARRVQGWREGGKEGKRHAPEAEKAPRQVADAF